RLSACSRPETYQRWRAGHIEPAARGIGGPSTLDGLTVALIETANGRGDDVAARLLPQPILERFEIRPMALHMFQPVRERVELRRELFLSGESFRPPIGEAVPWENRVENHDLLAAFTRL